MKAIDLFVLYQIVRRISTPFEKWDMYKTGVIDEKGEFLVPEKERTKKQLKSYSHLDVFILNIKKMLAKVPGGSSRMATFAAAIWLIREGKSLKEDVNQELDDLMKNFDQYMMEAKMLLEDEGGVAVPTSNTGNVAGKDNPMNISPKLKKKHGLKTYKTLTKQKSK